MDTGLHDQPVRTIPWGKYETEEAKLVAVFRRECLGPRATANSHGEQPDASSMDWKSIFGEHWVERPKLCMLYLYWHVHPLPSQWPRS